MTETSIADFLVNLRKRDVLISVEGENLVCNAPKNVITPELRQEIAARKADLLTFLAKADVDSFPRSITSEDLPITAAQQRLWISDQLNPGSPAYTITAASRMSGPLDEAAFRQSIDECITRHDALRMGFRADNGGPKAFLVSYADLPFEAIDLSSLNPEEQDISVAAQTEAAASHLFDLGKPPLCLFRLLRLSALDHILLLAVHHIVVDGWSLTVLSREIEQIYVAKVSGSSTDLRPAVSVRQSAIAEQKLLAAPEYQQQLTAWQRILSGRLQVLDLPFDRPRPSRRTSEGAAVRGLVSSASIARARAMANANGVTLFTFMFSVFQAMLFRLSGQTDIITGTPYVNRTAETENAVGMFVNLLPLRTDLSGDPQFTELLHRVRAVTWEAIANAAVPFDRLLTLLPGTRGINHPPVFQSMFSLNSFGHGIREFATLKTQLWLPDRTTSRYDITLDAIERPEATELILEYSKDIVDRDTARRWLACYETLLEVSISDPSVRLSELQLQSTEESTKVITDWNATSTDYDRNATIYEMFAERAQGIPHQLALTFEGKHLTYAELDSRIVALARTLTAHGSCRGRVAGVYQERSIDMVVTLLAILKTGAAYVPLDPAYPVERLAMMVDDSDAVVIVTHSSLRDRLPPTRAAVVCVDAVTPGSQSLAEDMPVSADDLAYVIYTSGSTGKPKGVEITHRNVVNFCIGMDLAIGSTPGVWLAVTSICFDISVLELLWTLTRGFHVVLLADEIKQARMGVARSTLVEQIVRYSVTHLQCTPAKAQMILADNSGKVALSQIRHMLVGGEALSVTLAERLMATLTGTLHNMYGPTETTVWSTAEIVTDADRITIGRPIANTQTYILDGHLQPVPIGVTGELYISGDGVANGYRNRPELTRERFVPNPFLPGQRLYKTGDLARYLPDGKIVFVGRADQQVKLRGHRIELGEIEAALERNAIVKEAVVIARTHASADAQLDAFVRLHTQSPDLDTHLRTHLRTILPEYMIPSAFIELEQFPLTPNGKVDRQRFEPVQAARLPVNSVPVVVKGALEQSLADVWRRVLGTRPFGLDDNFFDIGGNSLLVIQVQDLLRRSVSRDVPLMDMFEHPTIRRLATHLRKSETATLSAVGTH